MSCTGSCNSVGACKGRANSPVSVQALRDSRRGNSIGLIKCSSAFAACVHFFGKQGLRLLLSRELEPAGPVEDLLSFFLLLDFFFSREEEADNAADDKFWTGDETVGACFEEGTLERTIGGDGVGRVSSSARHVCAGLVNPCLVSLRLASRRVPTLRVFWNHFAETLYVCGRNAKNGIFSHCCGFYANKGSSVVVTKLSGWSEQQRTTQAPGRCSGPSFLFLKKFLFVFFMKKSHFHNNNNKTFVIS